MLLRPGTGALRTAARPKAIDFSATKERKGRKEKNQIFPVQAPFFLEVLFLYVLCALLWLNFPSPFAYFVYFAVKNLSVSKELPQSVVRCSMLGFGL
jgi:hypothetical protein